MAILHIQCLCDKENNITLPAHGHQILRQFMNPFCQANITLENQLAQIKAPFSPETFSLLAGLVEFHSFSCVTFFSQSLFTRLSITVRCSLSREQ